MIARLPVWCAGCWWLIPLLSSGILLHGGFIMLDNAAAEIERREEGRMENRK
jgi:hypothetical protein